MKIINETLEIAELKQMAQDLFGDMVKAVVDIERKIVEYRMPSLLKERFSKYKDFNFCEIGPGDGYKTFEVDRAAINSGYFDEINNFFMKLCFAMIQIFDKRNNPAFKNKLFILFFSFTFIC